MRFERQRLTMQIRDPARDFRLARVEMEQRWDPLTGRGARLLPACGLFPPADGDLDAVVHAAAGTCPFCPDRIEQATPLFPPEIIADGRLRRGEAVLFPNLHPYAQYSSVAVFSPRHHRLALHGMTPALWADNLAVQVAFVRAVARHEPDTAWASVNANHLPPSGSSVLHPHTQGSVHPAGTTVQRQLATIPADRFRDYLNAERAAGQRYLGSTGTIQWLVSYAPTGPAELRAMLFSAGSPEHLDDDRVAELGYGIATAVNFYAELGFTSYNLALYGTPHDRQHPMLLRMVCRSNPRPWYRSDVMWLERLHDETAVDVWPEEVAARAGDRFRR